MTEANCPNQTFGEKTATDECHTACEPLADHEFKAHAAEAASAVRAHLATCEACRDRHDGRASVPAHLSLLRDALARDEDQHAQACAATRGHWGRAAPSGRRPFRSAVTVPITLSQWVSRTASSGS
ncbi:zf-HC2 domain-containing protein [Streptomyces sp. NPDC006668]|uniref:zf-HC2 domain-containing protein n=1 Tax=Streptomyces sp. NPDC006668 TaxID=3156903 RepID=UPI0033C966ED